LGESQSNDSKALGQIEQSDIVGDGSDNSHDSRVEFGLSLGDGSAVCGEMSDYSGEGKGVSVESRLVESLMNDLIKLGVCPTF
jgi:hypothetical protein